MPGTKPGMTSSARKPNSASCFFSQTLSCERSGPRRMATCSKSRPSFEAQSNSDLPDGLSCDFRVQSLAKKYSAFGVGQITGLNPRVSRRMRGGSRSSRTLRWDAVDAGAATDERGSGGRRRRVVLMPRRWHQVGGGNSVNDGGKKARSPGRARYKP